MNISPFPNPQDGSTKHTGSSKSRNSYNWKQWKQRQMHTTPQDFNLHSPCETCDPDASPSKGPMDECACNTPQPLRDASSASSDTHALQSPLPPFPGSSHASLGASLSLASSSGADNSMHEARDFSGYGSFAASFQGDKRIKENTYSVTLNGRRFVVVSYAVFGHCDAVYRRSKKLWERIPLGQARVFVQLPQPLLSKEASLTPSPPPAVSTVPHSNPRQAEGGKGDDQYMESSLTTRSTSSVEREHNLSASRSFGNASSSLLLVAALNGIRRFGHWADTVTYGYGVSKETPVTAISTERIDGEGGHLTAFSLDGARYWVVGCRSVYLLLRVNTTEDLQLYDDDSSAISTANQGSFSSERSNVALAKHVALLWCQLLKERLSTEKVEQLHQELSTRKWTCCFDAVVAGWERTVCCATGAMRSPPTVCDLDQAALHGTDSVTMTQCTNSLCDRNQVRHETQAGHEASKDFSGSGRNVEGFLFFYAATLCEASEKGLCVPVLDAMDFFKRYSLQTVSYHAPIEVSSQEYDAYRVQMSSQINSAGTVLYGANHLGVVVRIWKCRSYPYIMERTAQELIVTHQLQGPELLAKLGKKLGSLPKGTRVHTIEWEKQRVPFLMDFAAWLHQTMRLTPSTNLGALRELRSQWVTTQWAYQREAAAGRRAGNDDTHEAALPAEETTGNDGDGPNVSDVLMLVGPQGCGKSTLSRALFVLLEQSGFSPCWLNQDEVGGRCGYLAAIRQAVSEGLYTHIILDKININDSLRLDYVPMNLNVVLTIAWTHLAGNEALAGFCFERVKRRGSNHKSFGVIQNPRHAKGSVLGMDPNIQLQRLRKIIHSCTAQYQLPEGDPTLLELDVTLNCNAIIRQVWSKLQERGQYNLPNLSTLNVAEALRVANGYEHLIAQYPHRITALVLKADDDAALYSVVHPDLLGDGKHKVKLDSVQILLHDFTVNPSPTMLVRCAPLIGKSIVARVTAIVADSRATLLCLGKGGASNGVAGLPWSTSDGKFLDSAYKSTAGRHSTLPLYTADMERYSNVKKDETLFPCIAVLSKAKKVSYHYCIELAQRVLNSKMPDPYCVMLPLQNQPQATFTYQFLPTR